MEIKVGDFNVLAISFFFLLHTKLTGIVSRFGNQLPAAENFQRCNEMISK